MAKQTYYFSHEGNARNDDRIIAVRLNHGMEGYGINFAILERLLESSDFMSVKDYNIIAFDLRVSAGLVKKIVEDYELFSFSDDGKYFYSKSFNRRMIPLEEFIFSIVIIKEEYIKPRRKLKHLNKRKYDFLYQNGFKRTEQLTIKGIYKEFIIIVHPKEMEILKRKNIRFDIIEILYQFGEGELRDYSKAENEMSGLYHVGNVEFIEGSAYFIPPQYTEPKFEEILFDLISILKREDLKPRIE